MTRKALIFLIKIGLLLALVFGGVNLVETRAADEEGVHNLNTGLNYATIQEAIDAPETLDGHTIFVQSGTYKEKNIVVNKSVVLIGENQKDTIIDASYALVAVNVTADNVVISRFTVQNTSALSVSILVEDVNNATVTENTVIGRRIGDDGIVSQNSTGSRIARNTVIGMGDSGILVRDSTNIEITGNNLTRNVWYGLAIIRSKNTSATDNTLSLNDVSGLYLRFAEDILIAGNMVTETRDPKGSSGLNIGVIESRRITMTKNLFSSRWNLQINKSQNCTITENDFEASYSNLELYGVDYIKFHHNNVRGGSVSLSGVAQNRFDDGIEGNYWSAYIGEDANKDGIGDTPYTSGWIADHYPLMGPFNSYNISSQYQVNVISNSAIDDVKYLPSNNAIEMHASNTSASQSTAFTRLCIPKDLIVPPYSVTVDDGLIPILYINDKVFYNNTHRWLYFAYETSSHKIVVQGLPPENVPPVISVLSPQTKTYSTRNISLTLIKSEPTLWMGFSLDDQLNVTINSNTTLVDLNDGTHTLIVYALDLSGNKGNSTRVHFNIDTLPPNIQILSPENMTYTNGTVALSFAVTESASWLAYNIDGQANVTTTGNTTVVGLADGPHSARIFARDQAGNIGTSTIVYFSIRTPQSGVTIQTLELIGAIVAAGAIATAGYVLFRRRKAKQVTTSGVR